MYVRISFISGTTSIRGNAMDPDGAGPVTSGRLSAFSIYLTCFQLHHESNS